MPEQATTYSVMFYNDFGSVYGPFRSLLAAVTFGLAESTDDHRPIVLAS